MSLTIVLPQELEERLIEESERRKLAAPEVALQLLDKYLPHKDRRAQLIALLQSWIEDEDIAEQKETGNYLIEMLDADRLSDRKLFPEELKGVTW
jgi:hypothetical protein